MDKKHWDQLAQHMLPAELIAERDKLPLVFLPVAGLEWHGPHLTIGTDGLNAQSTASQVAAQIGGVVMPTLFMSTERERPPEMLRSLGYQGDEYVVGMDFPKAPSLYPSQYFSEEIFAMTLSAHIAMYLRHGYKYVVIINGHGAVNHNAAIERLCLQHTHENQDALVKVFLAFPTELIRVGGIAHAGDVETSLMMRLDERLADVSRLPDKGQPLEYLTYGVVDEGGFTGDPGPGHTVRPECDPRNASAQQGEDIFKNIVADLTAKVRDMLQQTQGNDQ